MCIYIYEQVCEIIGTSDFPKFRIGFRFERPHQLAK